jgi:hypothetical protein
MKLEFSRQVFEKNIHISYFMKTRSVAAQVFRTDRQMADMTKVIVAFRDFAHTPKNDNK